MGDAKTYPIVGEVRAKAEEFVESLSEPADPVSVMAIGMIAGKMLGEMAANNERVKEEELEEIISIFCLAVASDARSYYNNKKSNDKSH